VGREPDESLTLLAAFANTQFYGDGMLIAPDANQSTENSTSARY
jgi:hypothetical protein